MGEYNSFTKQTNGWGGIKPNYFFEEVAIGGIVGRGVGLAYEGLTAKTFYRAMSAKSAEMFMSTGIMPAGTETFVSPTLGFAENYGGVLFKIRVDRGIVSELESIGVRNMASGHPLPNLPIVQKGWKSTNAFFKLEGTQVNIGLGNGEALNIFNSGIQNFKRIR